MLVSLIVAVYKDTEALNLIFETLSYQTYKNFEVVVAEDGQSKEMKECVENVRKKYDFKIIHTTQEDKGIRKARSQNNGILASNGEYLIFIDGDCLLYSTFIEGHVKLAKKNSVLSGRRVNLPQNLTQQIKNKKIKPIDIEKHYLTKYLYLAFDKSVRYEQGIYINPDSFLYKLINKKRNTDILGCNFSAWKSDIVRLNGFDEISYGESAIPDDTDWTWRFRNAGIEINSCKNTANMFHLWHKVHNRGSDLAPLKKLEENKKANKYICEGGLNLH